MRIKWLTILLYPQTGEEEQVKAELGGFIGVSKLTFRALTLRQSVVKSNCSERRFLFSFFFFHVSSVVAGIAKLTLMLN